MPAMGSRPHHPVLAILAFVLIGSLTMSTRAADRPVSLDDLLLLKTIRELDLDAEGRRAVIAVESFVTKPDLDDLPGKGDIEIRRHLALLDLEHPDAEPRPLTFGDRSDSSPIFSPDGRSIAFVRKPIDLDPSGPQSSRVAAAVPDPESKPQVWVLPLDGGEARPVTHFEHGAARPRWSPDGRSLVVESRIPIETIVEHDGPPVWKPTRPGRDRHDATRIAESVEAGATPVPGGNLSQVRAWLDANERARTPRLVDRSGFLGEREVEERLRLRQVFVVPVPPAGDEIAEPIRLGRGAIDRGDAVFSADGRSVIMVVAASAMHPDEVLDHGLEIVDLSTPEASRVVFAESGLSVADPQPGPDGSLIAFVATKTDEPNYRGRALGLVPSSGGDPIWATNGAWRSVNEYRWSRTAGKLVFTAGSDGAIPFYTASPATLEPVESHRLREGLPAQIHAFDIAGETTAWIESSAGNPSVLRVERATAGIDGTSDDGGRLVYDANPWIAERRIVRPTERTVERPDGTIVRSWLLPPVEVGADGKSPLILAIHGGPMAMWGPAEPTMWLEWQLAAAWGFGVVYANPRGSGGSGEAFQRGNHADWGAGPGGDCLAALDAACDTADWIDPDRLVVTGGSYGGYLTAWLIANDDRFKAAVAQRGVYDLTTFFGEGNAFRLVEWAFGHTPIDSEGRAALDDASPLRRAEDITTPLLILHGEQDLRVGVSQSAMLYRVLRQLGRPVEYVLYPGADHELSRSGDPVLRMDRLARILEFFARHVDVPGPTGSTD